MRGQADSASPPSSHQKQGRQRSMIANGLAKPRISNWLTPSGRPNHGPFRRHACVIHFTYRTKKMWPRADAATE
jgi:hypothetical protein